MQQRTKSVLKSSTVRSEVPVSDGAEDLRGDRRCCCCGKEKVVNATVLETASINDINLHSNMLVFQRWKCSAEEQSVMCAMVDYYGTGR